MKLFPKTSALLHSSKVPMTEALFAKMGAGSNIMAHSGQRLPYHTFARVQSHVHTRVHSHVHVHVQHYTPPTYPPHPSMMQT